MFLKASRNRILIGMLVVLAGTTGIARAESAEDKFYRAFYLEQAGGDWAAAAELYQEIASDHQADPELRSQAKAHLAICREELASGDFARLMPPEAWAYVEIKRPGDQFLKLLNELGLLAEADRIPTKGERRIAISPALIREGLGIRGAAVAITGFNPLKQVPSGVLVFHPGDLEVVRGLIETALPIGGQATEPIEGFATYQVEGKAFVTLTSRLVVVSSERSQIKGVLDRLSGAKKRSLATNPGLTEIITDRDDSLLLFFVNAKPMMPMLKGMMAAGAMASRELAMAQAVLDLDSLHSLTGRFGVADDGVFLDLGLRLDEGHHNLIYNFLRTPAINHETLKCVPAGAAAFLAGAMNEAPSRYSSTSPGAAGTPPIVTALDFGREIFGNITSFAVFALPPEAPVGKSSGPPIPDVAAAITVVDPAKSQALWTQMLGIASLAAGARVIEGAPVEIEGIEARGYRLPEGVTIYFTTIGNDVLVSSSRLAMARSILAKRSGQSILNDDAFAANLSRLSDDSTKALFAHAGRCMEIARLFMSPSEVKEVEPFLSALSNTVASVVVEHSGELFRLSAMVGGIPDVGDLVAKMVTEESRKQEANGRLTQAIRAENWDKALAAVEEQLREQPDSSKLLRAKFKILAAGKKDRDSALACADALFDKLKDNAKALNGFAWGLLTEDQYGGGYDHLALRFSERSNEMTDHGNWMFVDTLALAKFKTGNARDAVELEGKAIELCGGCSGAGDMKKALARFKSAAATEEPTGDKQPD